MPYYEYRSEERHQGKEKIDTLPNERLQRAAWFSLGRL